MANITESLKFRIVENIDIYSSFEEIFAESSKENKKTKRDILIHNLIIINENKIANTSFKKINENTLELSKTNTEDDSDIYEDCNLKQYKL